MIKLVIFDLDGVLVDAKEIHYESLNRALTEVAGGYTITREEHMNEYDGLPTKTKLQKLSSDKGLPEGMHSIIWLKKQQLTAHVIKDKVPFDDRLRSVLQQLKNDGHNVYVCSNSIRESLKLMLYKSGLIEFVDYYMANEDTTKAKPSPEIYLRAMVHAGAKPSETIIIEDSYHGRESAVSSGGYLCAVDSPTDVTYDRINKQIKTINGDGKGNRKWESENFNILIPMAGAGSRFATAGYTFPKPLIEVNHKPMIQVVVENLNIKANFIYLVQKAHYEKYNLKYLLNLITPNCKIIQVDGVTEGAACTTLLAKEYFDNDNHLLIANSDQFIEWDSANFYYAATDEKIDGSILTFEATHPKWSFVKLGEDGHLLELAEKKPISNIATVGIYHWSKGSDYVKYAEQMIEKDIRVNGEFYVAPVYNEAVLDNKKIKTYTIDEMWGLGTPEDLNKFIDNYRNEKR
tara:strand:+ start:4546 stop:5928 length:1383 start_codon:yes stop_codon:yes gene_type:complete